MNRLSFAILAGIVAASGCTMAPKYERPAAPVASNWPTGPAYDPAGQTNTATVASAADLGWREFFGDPRLIQLLDLALTNNRDLRVAVLNVETARAQYRIQRSALFPAVNANGGGIRQRVPGDVSGRGQPLTTSQYSVNAGVTAWELDLFGRIRSLKD